ncbi:tetratricopeptide repeat protein [Litorivicinus lipolyticus]|uniref:tetratricopeptide repeat protein n=1 Tax=Litorivicinus lipolyticus TaxID=418701 RepID=UPI003B5945B1
MKWIPLFVLLSSGCASLTGDIAAPPHPQAAPVTPMAPGTLGDLLSAEIALNQGQPAVAFDFLHRQAQATGDRALIRRAARVGTQAGPANALRSAIAFADAEPESFEAQALVARAYLTDGNAARAAGALHAAALLRADQPLGFVRDLINDKPALAQQLTDALGDDDGNGLAIEIVRAHAIEQATGPRAALTVIKALAARHPKDLGALSELARLSQQTGDIEAAISALRQARRYHPDNLGLTQTLAQLLVGETDYASAIGLFDDLIALADDPAPYRLSQAMLAMELEQLDLAEQRAQEIIDQVDYRDDALLLLGTVAIRQGRLGDARGHLSQVRGDSFLSARFRFAEAAIAQTPQAIAAWFDEARAVRPDLAAALTLSRAQIIADSGDKAAALQVLDGAIERSPDDTELLYGRAMMRDGDDLAGIEADLNKTLALDPDDASALNALGYTYADANLKLEQALSLIGRALAIRPDDPAILDSMGWVEYRLGNLATAAQWLERALALLKDAEIGAHLGEVQFAMGLQDQARATWRDAQTHDADNPVLIETLDRLIGSQSP